jgi:hypothetical protein
MKAFQFMANGILYKVSMFIFYQDTFIIQHVTFRLRINTILLFIQ